MLLAIDQGASKTSVALVGTDGAILSTASAAGACYFSAGVDVAFRYIQIAAEQAAEKINGTLNEIDYIFAGLAGANWPDEIEMLKQEFHNRYKLLNVTVCNDCVVALRGGSEKDDSIILCAGSACNGAVMVNGKIKQVFNNYIPIQDQGGVALGNRALQAVFDSHVGIRPATVLTERLLDYYGCNNVDQLLIGRDHGTLQSSALTVVPLLARAAEENDQVALSVIYEFSKSVARFAVSSLRKYDLVGKDCDVVLSGGVFKSENPLFIETISTEVHRVSRQAKVVNAKYEPIVGAALLGLEAAGMLEKSFIACRQSAVELDLLRRDRMRDGK